MINKEILINKETREIINGENGNLFRLGVDGENLQENIIFKFNDEFVNGTARVEIIMQDETKSYVMTTKMNETYVLPVKSIITKTGLNKMQLVITQGTDDEEIPIFKSEMFNFFIAESIDAEIVMPDEYPQWIDEANAKLNELSNFDIDAEKVDDTTTITITDRYGLSKSVQVFDGTDGKDAKINGVNTLNIKAGTNITLEQEDDTLTINSQGGGSGAVSSVNGQTGDVVLEIPTVPTNVSSFENDAGYLTEHQDISGKQDVIDSTNKLSADLVDDTNSLNKFTNATEKATWNAKSDFSGDYNDLTNKPVIPQDTNYVINVDLHKSSSNPLIITSLKPGAYALYSSNFSTTENMYVKAKAENTENILISLTDFSKENVLMVYSNVFEHGNLAFSYSSNNGLTYMIYRYRNNYNSGFSQTSDSYPLFKTSSRDSNTISSTNTYTGTNTFNTLPTSSIVPTTDNQMVNKKYVDDSITSAITTALNNSY